VWAWTSTIRANRVRPTAEKKEGHPRSYAAAILITDTKCISLGGDERRGRSSSDLTAARSNGPANKSVREAPVTELSAARERRHRGGQLRPVLTKPRGRKLLVPAAHWIHLIGRDDRPRRPIRTLRVFPNL